MSFSVANLFLSSLAQTSLVTNAEQGSDQNETSQTTFQDTNLEVPVEANTSYLVIAWITYNADAVPDIKMTFKNLADATISWGWTADGTPTTKTFGDALQFNGLGTDNFACIMGTLKCASTASGATLMFQYAQVNSSANDCKLLAKSSLMLIKVA